MEDFGVCARWLILALLPLLIAAGTTQVPVTAHVLVDDAGRAATDGDITAWIATANDRFAAAGIQLVVSAIVELERDAVIDDVVERNALASDAPKTGAVHLFIARSVADKDQNGDWLGGVHWRYGGDKRAWRGRRYIILSATGARPDTCAHELGHFFGLGHRTEDENLMNGQRTIPEVHFDAVQLRTIASKLRAARKNKELIPAPAAAPTVAPR